MANYSSYKIVQGDQFVGAAVTATKFSGSPNSSYGVKWFFGTMCRCSPGCCCLWSVPSDVQNMWIQAWGSGGNGTGACSCSRCHHWEAAQGGYYNSKMIETNGNCQYTVCAGGVYPCLSRECYGCMGCTSYVNGYNYQTSVLLVDREEMLTQTGLKLVRLITHVVDSLETTEETLDLETILVHGRTPDMIPTEVGVTVIIMVILLLLHL